MTWFEEPVSSADFEGLRLLRDRGPAGMDDRRRASTRYVARDFVNLLGGAVDCLQADVTRCGGITGFLRAGALAAAHGLDLSAPLRAGGEPRRLYRASAAPPPRVVPRPCAGRAELFDGVPEPEGASCGRIARTPARARAEERRRGALRASREPIVAVRSAGRGRVARSGSTRASSHASSWRVEGEVRFNAGTRALYTTGGSNYRQVPIGIVIPRTVEDVVAAVEVCREHDAPVLSRGGGTSLAGQARTSPSSSTSRST